MSISYMKMHCEIHAEAAAMCNSLKSEAWRGAKYRTLSLEIPPSAEGKTPRP